jgi:hypothetical protein
MDDILQYGRITELTGKINELGHYISYADRENPDVSSKGIDWHLDHSLKVIIKAYEDLQSSDPETYIKNTNASRIRFFSAGYFPRGIAQAAKSVMPPDEIKIQDIYSQINEAKLGLAEINTLDKRCYFNHPYFGPLHVELAIEFFIIHTEHHLKIIREILS